MELKLTKTFLSKKTSSKSFLIAALSLCVLTLFFGANQEIFSANGYLIFEKKEYWRAFTTSLLHADLNHLAHNAFFFTGLAVLLNNYFGFWVFPVVSLIAGGIINMLTLYFYPPTVTLVGISGVVYFMASFWLTLYILIERRQKLHHRFIHALAVSLIFLFPEAFERSTSYLAHGFGFLVGVPFGITYYLLFEKEIRAKDEWMEVKKDRDDIILLDESSYHLVTPEEDVPSPHASHCAQCPQH